MTPIKMPAKLARLPTDSRGFPITYTVFITSEGKPDFTTSDPLKWMSAYKHRLCGLCGLPLKRNIWFIGGPLCMQNRVFFDHPMHEECARYALVVCPYLAMAKYLGAKSRPTPDDMRVELASSNSTKPDRFGLAKTNGYRGIIFQGDTLLQANPWLSVEWWKDGKPIDV